ncbi:MAG TPA: flagellar motor switch protein FliN [Chloroflexota bacterium]|nr:flagellar motor switch protein FliN [Chloroflexota bacterium]
MRNLDSDPFGLGGTSAPLSDAEIDAVTPFAATVRDNALTIIHTVFNKEAEVANVAVNTVTGGDVETALVGDYFLIEVNLQGRQGELYPCLTFLQRDETVAAFDLDVPADPSDWSQQVERLQNPIELLTEAVNGHLGVDTAGDLTFVRPTVRAVNMPEDYASLLIAPDENWVEVNYHLVIADVGEMQVTSLVAYDLVRRLAGQSAPAPAAGFGAEPAAPAAGRAAASDPLLGFGLGGSDPFNIPTGRTGADILESIPPLTESSSLGGLGMGSSAPAGFGAGSAGRGVEAGGVRPAQFPSFGESPAREPVSNIDLILDVNLRVTVELGRTSKSIREVLDLGPGAVIELDKLAGEPVDILVNDKPIAKGEVVVVDENFGVRVTDIISPQGRVASLK